MRFRRLLDTDPGGAWVAERDGALAGAALALLREGLWGLSLLVVDPPAQCAGAGPRAAARAPGRYGDGARGRVILSSPDPRAMRAYARLGLDAAPVRVAAKGAPRGVAAPAERPRRRRRRPPAHRGGRPRGPRRGARRRHRADARRRRTTLLVAPERGYAVLAAASVRLLAALDDAAARDLLRAALARVAEPASRRTSS